MNQQKPADELLENAARLIEMALRQLDTEFDPCQCCGSKRYRHLVEFRVAANLDEVPAKLKREAAYLRGDGNVVGRRAATRPGRSQEDE